LGPSQTASSLLRFYIGQDCLDRMLKFHNGRPHKS
jgi:hypothetical protein